jgi:hypothetical protein
MPAAPTALIELGEKVCRATRIPGLTVESAPAGKEVKIILDGRTISYLHTLKSGAIRVHVMHYAPRKEERVTCENVAEAAKAVKTSERRRPKPAKPAKAKLAAVEPPAPEEEQVEEARAA